TIEETVTALRGLARTLSRRRHEQYTEVPRERSGAHGAGSGGLRHVPAPASRPRPDDERRRDMPCERHARPLRAAHVGPWLWLRRGPRGRPPPGGRDHRP